MLQNQSFGVAPAGNQAGRGRDPTPGAWPHLSGFLSCPPPATRDPWLLSCLPAPTTVSVGLLQPPKLTPPELG